MGTINCKNNHENLTYRQLKEMVPATPKGKMPSPDKIEGKILFRAKEHDAKIVIFKNGYLTYTKNDGFGDPCTTVYSVHRCNQIVYKTGCSEDEFNEECGQYGKNCKLIYRIINGQRIRFAIILTSRGGCRLLRFVTSGSIRILMIEKEDAWNR